MDDCGLISSGCFEEIFGGLARSFSEEIGTDFDHTQIFLEEASGARQAA